MPLAWDEVAGHSVRTLLFSPKVNGYTTSRDRAASAAVGDRMVVLGGLDGDGQDLVGFEVYDEEKDEWIPKPEWQMAQGRYR